MIRVTDYVSRLGGDEFSVILTHLKDYSGAGKVVRKLIDGLNEPFTTIFGESLTITYSIGISVAPQDSNDPLQLLHDADLAMYQAKASGRNCYQFYTSILQEEVLGKLSLERELRLAVDSDELEPWYQPQYSLNDMELIGFEALIKNFTETWDDRGPIKGQIGFMNSEQHMPSMASNS
ncbi:diguanylate cyclase [Parendozoicomonas sp. Alg238-R29]|uniref:diguanylate cyclase domain-containing protein n=1 Tax=Parendozoicomonas sp. Alg238-R29 TaxID=2993446 RepID=UPI00248E26B7|nr:diguanylate cyclase [Parendozoicomonas sp. Alg238-R29]